MALEIMLAQQVFALRGANDGVDVLARGLVPGTAQVGGAYFLFLLFGVVVSSSCLLSFRISVKNLVQHSKTGDKYG